MTEGTAPPGAPPQLTVVILTYNEARNIQSCIESLLWADRVLIFDCFSQDDTVSLARAAGAEVIQHEFRDFAQQRNAALERLKTDWVFFVDADERGTPELAAEIRQVISARPEKGWYVPRHNYIFGRLISGGGWFPDYQLRLFKQGHVRYKRPVHEIAVVDGEIGHLSEPLIHMNYRDLNHFRAKQRKYTSYDATILKAQGIRPWPHKFIREPLRQFWWRFFTLGGYRDGIHGLWLSILMAYYEWVKYRKLAWLWSKR
jgi:(heptosyl)LPS beta-1,4-glucosyltransferase